MDESASEALLPLLRHPKPTYMRGLSRYAEAFVQGRTNKLALVPEGDALSTAVIPCSGPLRVRDVTIDYSVEVGHTGPMSSAIRRAFGLARTFRIRTGVQALSFAVQPGEVCYIYGASGSGKTSLLDFLKGTPVISKDAQIEGKVAWPADARIDTGNQPVPTDKPLIEAVGGGSLTQGSVGFSTPPVCLNLKGCTLVTQLNLARGQLYRSYLAHLICSDANVWLLDEFASGLDDATAMAVGRTFARAARTREVICIIAAVKREPLLNAVSPDVFISLNQLGESVVTRDWEAACK